MDAPALGPLDQATKLQAPNKITDKVFDKDDNRHGAGAIPKNLGEARVEENDFITDNPPTPPPRVPNKGLQEDMDKADSEFDQRSKSKPKGTVAPAYRTNQVRQGPKRGGKQHDVQSMGGGRFDAITRVNDPLEVKSA